MAAAQSCRIPSEPGDYAMLPAGTTDKVAAANRRHLAAQLGFAGMIMPKLIHGTEIYEVADDYDFSKRPEADAIITNRTGCLIGVATADCIGLLMYDPAHRAVAAVHSGYRGTAAKITEKVVARMAERYGSRPSELLAYMGPAPTQAEYLIGRDRAELFDEKYLSPAGPALYGFDNRLAVLDQLLAAGLTPDNIETSRHSSYEEIFHSYRRDGQRSGRHATVIGLR